MSGHNSCPRVELKDAVTQLIKLSFMTFKSTKYAKIITDAKKKRNFDNIKFPQLRFYCKYYKENFEYRSECPEIIGKNLF